MAFSLLLNVALLLLFRLCSGKDSCEGNKFPCDDGECVDAKRWCDSAKDCVDGSDEAYCKESATGFFANKDPNKCKENYFKCSNGPCIPQKGRCDGYSSCGDKSDEENCSKTLTSTNDTKVTAANSSPPAAKLATSSSSKPTRRSSLASSVTDTEAPLQKAIKWLLSQRQDDFGWGEETERALIALYLSIIPQLDDDLEYMLMSKQLDVKLGIALTRNETNPMTLSDLSLYINALVVTCRNPRNFYGHDLVSTLRYKVDVSRTFVTPFVYLTLCLNGETRDSDVRRLTNFLVNTDVLLERSDMKASAMLACTCIEKLPHYRNSTVVRDVRNRLLQKLTQGNLPGNIYELALFIQALKAVPQSESNSKLAKAINLVLEEQKENGSFGDILATYYVMPILSGRSLLSLDDHCGRPDTSDFTPIEVLKNTRRGRIFINYVLRYGDPTEVEQTLLLKVAEGTNFLDIMRLAQEINPKYRFSLDNSRNSPSVYSIGGIPNDVERGVYWNLYVESTVDHRRSANSASYRVPLYTASMKQLVPKSNDRIIFWLKPFVS